MTKPSLSDLKMLRDICREVYSLSDDYRHIANCSDGLLAYVVANWNVLLTAFANNNLLPCSCGLMAYHVVFEDIDVRDASQVAVARQTLELRLYSICYVWIGLSTGRDELLAPSDIILDVLST
jgi:hypothetical protein